MARRLQDQNLGVYGTPITSRISTPGRLRGALICVLQYDHNQMRSMPNGWLLLSDGLTTIELSPRMRRRISPLVRFSPLHGPQLVQLTLLGRLALFADTAWRFVTKPFRQEIPF